MCCTNCTEWLHWLCWSIWLHWIYRLYSLIWLSRALALTGWRHINPPAQKEFTRFRLSPKSPRDVVFKPCMYAFRRPSNTVCVVLSEIDQLQHTGSARAWSLVPSIVFDCELRSRLSPKIPRDVVYKPCLYALRRPSDTVCVVPSEIDQLQHTGLYCLMLLAPLNAHDRPGTSSFWSGFTMSFLWRQFFHMSLLDGTA